MKKLSIVLLLLALASPAMAQDANPGEPAPGASGSDEAQPPAEADKPDEPDAAPESSATPDQPASAPASAHGEHHKKKCPECKDGQKCERCAAHAEGKPKCKDGKCPKSKCDKAKKGDCDKRMCEKGKCEGKGSKCPKGDCEGKKGKCDKGKRPKCTKRGTSLSWSASIRPRGEFFVNRHFGLDPGTLNYPRPDEVDLVSQQTRLALKARRGELSAKLQLQHVAAWGVHGGDALTDGPIGLHQAWFQIDASDKVKLRVGRQELAYGAHRVLGNVGWHQVGRAWDGFKLMSTLPADIKLDVFGAQYAEGWVEQPATYTGKLLDEDAYLLGLYASAKVEPAFTNADVYVLYDARIESPEAGQDDGSQLRRGLLTTGARLTGKWSIVDAEVEGAFQTGGGCVPDGGGACTDQDFDQSGFFADAEVGVTLVERLRLFVGFGQATGDDPETEEVEAYNHLYPTAHKFLGYMDIIGPRSNVRELRGGAAYGFSEKRGELALTVHDFTRLQPDEERVGLEVDVVAGWKFYDGFSGLVGWAIFLPDEGITTGEKDPVGNAQWVFVQGVAKF